MLRLFLLSLIFSTQIWSSWTACASYELIRHKASGFVIDLEASKIMLQEATSVIHQKWRFDCAKTPGSFIITSATNLIDVLDVDTDTSDNNVILARWDSSYNTLTQQWYLDSDGHIINKYLGLALDTLSGVVPAQIGETLVVREISQETTQFFYLQTTS